MKNKAFILFMPFIGQLFSCSGGTMENEVGIPNVWMITLGIASFLIGMVAIHYVSKHMDKTRNDSEKSNDDSKNQK